MRFKPSRNLWNLWFAWYPVTVEEEGNIVWLEFVWRKGFGLDSWNYKINLEPGDKFTL